MMKLIMYSNRNLDTLNQWLDTLQRVPGREIIVTSIPIAQNAISIYIIIINCTKRRTISAFKNTNEWINIYVNWHD